MDKPSAALDHVGIAVSDLNAALAFFRDALGLAIEPPEEVASQRVRAHFIPAGGAALELLEATAPDSPIAKYLDKRGPGLHHITLRVPDIAAALERLKARGVRLVDERPRPGAGGSLVAFVHPSSAHGVLVELKQSSPEPRAPVSPRPQPPAPGRYKLGAFDLISLNDGFIGLDGGAMFGTIPKPLWSKQLPADDRNRVRLAMRPLVVRGARTMLIDAGLGDKGDEKFRDIYAVDRARNLDHALAAAGLAPEDIDIVLATHLHFDHAGGFTSRGADGRFRPRFPRAQYIVRRGEWDDASHPHERNRASYLSESFAPLADAGVLQLVDEDSTIMPGVRVKRTGGHTREHQMVVIESEGQTAVFIADILPTRAHLPAAWVMGFDLYPVESLSAKKAFVRDAAARNSLVFLEHDPEVAAVYIKEVNGKPAIVPA